MSIAQSLPDQFLLALWQAYFNSAEFKCALYTSDAELGNATAAYTTTGEVSGTGYNAGGATLVKTSGYPQVSGGIVYMHFENPEWPTATFTARGALIYNASTNAPVAVLNFSRDFAATGQTFRIKFGSVLPNDALIRAQRGQ
jgi:hypothetical protein